MRCEGTIKSWNEGRGFGFLAPVYGGQDIFIHISALPSGTGVPKVGQPFTFEIELNDDGKKRAVKVEHLERSFRPRKTEIVPSPSKNRFSTFVAAVVVLIIITLCVKFMGNRIGVTRTSDEPSVPLSSSQVLDSGTSSSSNVQKNSVISASFKCDSRIYCSQMASCSEAKFFLANCPGIKMDGDHDGIPCEQQWCQ